MLHGKKDIKMGYLADYLHSHSGNEAPDSFYILSALTLLGHVVGTKVYYMNGQYKTLLSLYSGLIGTAGSGKSTAKNAAKDTLRDCNFLAPDGKPKYLTSASIQSREDIIKTMGADSNIVCWKDKVSNQIVETHPFFIMANEFQNFMSVNPIGMVSFLVDIHGEKHFSDSYKNQGSTSFPNPHMSILSCGTKEWVMSELKLSLLSGGLGRRLILCVDEPKDPIAFPHRPDDWKLSYDRVISHLKRVESEAVQGEFVRTDSATKWYNAWYYPYRKAVPEDPILAQFHSTKNVMLQKLATLLALEDYNFSYSLTDEHFERAKLFLDSLEPKIKSLSVGIGRNDIAVYVGQIYSTMDKLGGALPKNKILERFCRDLKMSEFEEVLSVLQKVHGVQMLTNGTEIWYATPDRAKKIIDSQKPKP